MAGKKQANGGGNRQVAALKKRVDTLEREARKLNTWAKETAKYLHRGFTGDPAPPDPPPAFGK